jgi:hypothetical protein
LHRLLLLPLALCCRRRLGRRLLVCSCLGGSRCSRCGSLLLLLHCRFQLLHLPLPFSSLLLVLRAQPGEQLGALRRPLRRSRLLGGRQRLLLGSALRRHRRQRCRLMSINVRQRPLKGSHFLLSTQPQPGFQPHSHLC